MGETNRPSGDALPLDHVFDFEGQAVRYGAIGEGAPLVMVHGTPFSSQVWRRIAPIAARSRRVHYFDLLGYGASDMRDGQDVSLGVQNRVLAALLEHWRSGWHGALPDVLAHDFGGSTSLRAALLNGCAYRSLMLVDPVAVAPWGSPFVRHVRQHEAAFAGVPPAMHCAMLDVYLQGAAHRSLPEETLRIYTEPWTGERGQTAFYRQIAQMDQRYTDEVQSRYGELTCPISILWGEEDAWIPVERGVELASRMAGARFTRVPASGHLMQDDAPEAIVAEWLTFMSAIEHLPIAHR
ncbi:alpha/beta hydrolase (plasmid) [Burkholderia sp. SFA1]|uniref:alpha/beta fold hydrolase n=1 Tax=unclassified Caballeronia TaxID=2646786 RepID=UPI001F30BAF6|nr:MULTISPECIES: alpha/beta hydrolase [unclassified Caballeronia]MCE4546832.1 alpha/beta hydrolase [Caballeronia sp. PC1]MCE4572695.1 alpha/beta hydrolase [Caballeronia sp. CLC5]BBQ01931.1 alpha/beta hydrolase [Burkholderia sp. SFA1]